MNQTFKRFLHKLQQNMLKLGIQPHQETILVACSGGIDSTSLVHSLHTCGYNIQVAHVNYTLRSEESDANERFVSDLCRSLDIPLHVTSFDTKSIQQSTKRNLQELARELRYQWFHDLLTTHHLHYIATAHHADDQAETLLFNFIKGSALNGLSGISEKKEHIIRPFLNFNRIEIAQMCAEQDWGYSIDSSNEKNDYTRNFIRNSIMPLVKVINPGISDTLQKQATLYSEINSFLNWSVKNQIQQLLISKNDLTLELDLSNLRAIPGYIVILYDLMRAAGFTNDQVQQVSSWVDQGKSGLLIQSPKHQLLINRSVLILTGHTDEKKSSPIIWKQDSEKLILPDDITISRTLEDPVHIPAKCKIKIARHFMTDTLFLRHWRHGDVFYPNGMKGRSKKVSDYFTDAKLSRFEKDTIWILTNVQDEIIWISGMRADHRFIPTSSELSCWIYIEN